MKLPNIPHKQVGAILFAIGLFLLGSFAVKAGDLPIASGSDLAGIAFDDRPLELPVQRDFQMAMLTASSELGRSCGVIESYGWRFGPTEQDRVNQVFNATVDKLRAQGFIVETKAPRSVSRDITMFTADKQDKNLLFMWSAGKIGLVMVVCETSAPIGGRLGHLVEDKASSGRGGLSSSLAGGSDRRPSKSTVFGLHEELQKATPYTSFAERERSKGDRLASFSIIGDWVGTYTCTQGTTGGTLSIKSVKGDRFEGVFKFYPTIKSPYVAKGSYTVYGEYDADSQRILVNPGKWMSRPHDYYNTIMIGGFDVNARTFSGYFQGITGCTSFEAYYRPLKITSEKVVKEKPVAKEMAPRAKKSTEAKKAVVNPPVAEVKPAVKDTGKGEAKGIEVGTPTAPVAAPAATVPAATATP